MADIQSIARDTQGESIINEKSRSKDGISNISTPIMEGEDLGHGQVVFDDVEAHIRYKEFKTKQVRALGRV